MLSTGPVSVVLRTLKGARSMEHERGDRKAGGVVWGPPGHQGKLSTMASAATIGRVALSAVTQPRGNQTSYPGSSGYTGAK